MNQAKPTTNNQSEGQRPRLNESGRRPKPTANARRITAAAPPE